MIKLTYVAPKVGPGVPASRCVIGQYYRCAEDKTKVYLCTRDTAHDDFVPGTTTIRKYGSMMVSLTHGNRMTRNGENRRFIPVSVSVQYEDVPQ